MKVFGDERGFLSIFKKKPKPNLTPDISYPTQEQLYFTGEDSRRRGDSLRDFASKGIRGEGLGFGPEFVERASNPVIASREARFREQEMPQLSSQLSSRGLARSAGPNLATDVLSRAGAQKERDINEVMAQFYEINERQKKTDQTQALNLAGQLQNQQAGMMADQASASERLANATAGQQIRRDEANRSDLDKLGAMLLSGASGAMGAVGGGSFDVSNLIKGALGGASGSQSSILGTYSADPIVQLLRSRGYDV